MAVKWPLANGNWSNAANWNDGTLPVAGDDVYADGRTITIDVADITVSSIRTDIRSGGTAGGRFNLGSGVPIFNITANIFTGSVSSVITLNIGVSCTLNLIGNLFGAVGSGLSSAALNLTASNVTLNITGNLTTGSGQRTDCITVTGGSGSTINVIGNITNIGNIQSAALGGGRPDLSTSHIINNFNINITGNIEGTTGGSTDISVPVMFRFGSNNTFVLNGIARQNSSNGMAIRFQLSDNNNSITLGECTVETLSSGNAVRLEINSSTPNPGGTINITRLVQPSTGFKEIVNITDPRCKYIVSQLVLPTITKVNRNNFIIECIDNLDNELFLTGETSDITSRLPLQTDVRRNISYNAGNLIGTLDVPSPSNVRKDIPTDNTVGTADLTAEDFWTYANRSLNTEVTSSLNTTQTQLIEELQSKINELYQLQGLDNTNPLTVSVTQRTAGDIVQIIQTTGQNETQETVITRV